MYVYFLIVIFYFISQISWVRIPVSPWATYSTSFYSSRNWAGDNCLRVVSIKVWGAKPQGPCIALSLSSLEPIPQLLHVRNGNLKASLYAILRHVWNRQHCAGVHVCCDQSDNIVLSQAHGLLAGVIADGQADSEIAQSVPDSLVCEGTVSCSSRETWVPVLHCAQVPLVVHVSSHHPELAKLDDFLLVSGRL